MLADQPGEVIMVEVRVSVPDTDTATRISQAAVREQLAACVQVLGPMTSIYTWRGEVHRADEWLLLMKSTAAAFEDICELVENNHRYDVPEIMAVPVTHALANYASWVDAAVTAPAGAHGRLS